MKLLGSIYIAIAILVLTTAISWYVDVHNDRMHQRHLAVHTQLERMVRLKQELNAMLTLAVLQENTLRASTYDRVHSDLNTTLKSVQQLTQTLGLSNEMAVVQADHDKLGTIESQAIAAMEQEQWPQARRLLFDDDYLLTKKIYEINSETAVGVLTAELGNQAQHLDRLRSTALGLRVGAVLLLLGVSVVFSRRLRQELHQHEHMEREIQAANAQLEDSVRRRTAELEEANRRLATLSTTDSLTGLANRRKFDEVWQAEWQRATRQGSLLAVIMLDVDFFKRYNDHCGHQAGDACLQQVANILAGGIHRAGELVARYGGEEFVLVLPGADLADAYASAERIRAAVQAAAIPHPDSPLGPVVTISLGLAASIPCVGTPSEQLLRAADDALYQAKAEGRNRCCGGGPSSGAQSG
jgi:diguanylate cyclase (GGDEF)-like protein